MARLWSGLEDARSGSGRLILVSGPPGVGKSRLVAEFSDRVSRDGRHVLVGRSWEAGGAPPYWPWVQAMRSYFRAVDPAVAADRLGSDFNAMVTLLPELRELRPDSPPSLAGDTASDRFLLFDAVSSFLRTVAEIEPVVIVLDDLQAADVPSLLLLQFVAGQVSESRLLIVATYRDVELTPHHFLAPILAELRRAPLTADLPLQGLTAEEVTHFVEAVSPARPPRFLALALHRQTSGNPLFLEGAVRLLSSDEGSRAWSAVTRLPVPPEIRAVIERRLEGLSTRTRDALCTAAVFGNEFELDAVRRVHGTSPDEMLELLGEALAAELVVELFSSPGRFRFGHDLIRHSLHSGLAPALRVGLHRRAAQVLEEAYGSRVDDHLAELALHHFEAAAGGSAEMAIEFGRRAGDRAMAVLGYEEAVRLYQMAIQAADAMGRTQPVDVDLLLSLGDASVRAGDLPAAGEAFLGAAAMARRLGDPQRLARAAVGYGGRFVLARAGGDERMVPLLQESLILLGDADDELRVRLLSRLACAIRGTAPREQCDAFSRQALELARRMDDPHTLVYALAGRAGAIWWPENPEERLELGQELVRTAETIGMVEGVMDGHMTRCAALSELGDLAGARRELEALSRLGGPMRLPAQYWLEGAIRTAFALVEGVFEDVERRIGEMVADPPPTPARDNISSGAFQLFLLKRMQGRLGDIEDGVRRAADEFPWYPLHRVALAYLLLTLGHPEDAGQILREMARDRFASLPLDNYWVISLCLASEVAVRTESRETAQVIFELLEPHGMRNSVGFMEGVLGSVARYLGLLATFLEDLDAAEAHLLDAEAFNRRMGARTWLAYSLHDRAALLRKQARPGDEAAIEALSSECRELCREMGLGELQAALDEDFASSGGERPVPTGSASARFTREGEYFSVFFGDEPFRLRDSKGLRYLSLLLGSPGREMHVLDMVAGVEGVDPAMRGRVGTGGGEPLHEAGTGPMLDRQARQAYEQRLKELDIEIADAEALGDGEQASLGRQEQDFLLGELAAAMGLGGRDRTAASAAERARVNVTRSIRSAMRRIAEQNGDLSDHLEATIHTGAFCSYRPDPRAPVGWTL